MFKKFKSKIKNHNSGMTLIELLVVLAIFAIISSITMFDYASFKSSASLNNLANDISLSIRKAQSYAVGVRREINGSFNDGYRVYFSTDNKKSFTVLSGLNTNDNVIEELSINGGDFISGYIINDTTDKKEGDLDIIFTRPNLDASFYLSGSNRETISKVGIILSNQKEDRHKIIRVTNTGQISIENYAQ